MQLALGLDGIVIGLIFIPLAISTVIFFYISTRISNILGYKRVLSISFIINIIGILILRFQFSMTTNIIDLIPGIFIIGIGMGLCFTEASHLVMSPVKSNKRSDASGFMVSINNIGASLGTALVGVIFILSIFSGLYITLEKEYPNISGSQLKQEIEPWIDNAKSSSIEQIGNLNKPEITRIVNESLLSSIKISFDFIALILAIGFFLSLFLRPVNYQEQG